jgi:hypothetical protein
VFEFDLISNRFVIYKRFENRKVFSILKPGPGPFSFSPLNQVHLAPFLFSCARPSWLLQWPISPSFSFLFFSPRAPHTSLPRHVSQPVFPMHHTPPDGPAAAQGRCHRSPRSTGAEDRRKHRKIFPNGIKENSNGIMFESH